MAENQALEWENAVVLSVVQALLGMIDGNLRGVSVEIDGETITLHFAVAERNALVQEDLQEIVSDVEAFLWPRQAPVKSTVHVGSARQGWSGSHHRMVFLSKL